MYRARESNSYDINNNNKNINNPKGYVYNRITKIESKTKDFDFSNENVQRFVNVL